MLVQLSIKNYALIQDLEMRFDKGFTVITGETGAGKSILLGALGLVLGNRADTAVLLKRDSKCIVESHFNIADYKLQQFFMDNDLDYEDNTIIRREINPQGKSRGFINDTPVKLNLLRDLGSKLVNIHSQHQTITLNDSNFQLAVIDQYAGLQNAVMEFRDLYQDYIGKVNHLNRLKQQENRARTDQDFLQYQLDELEKAKLKVDEQESIEKEMDILNHAEQIKSTLISSLNELSKKDNNIIGILTEINQQLGKLGHVHEQIKILQQRLDSTIIEIDDISQEIERLEQDVDVDPQKAQALGERLDLIYQLQHKHHLQTVGELLEVAEHIREQIASISSLGDQIEDLQRELTKQKSILDQRSKEISTRRKDAIPGLVEEITDIIRELGMPQAGMSIQQKVMDEPGRDGIDIIAFKFNANKGGPQEEIAKIASGGELSRLMLAVKSLISTRNLLPTIIFDEIDAGVSGDVAGKVGKILRSMAGNMQVIVITHLPQIAGKGEYHFRVYKDIVRELAVTRISKLDPEGRVEEIAKLLSDEKVTTSAVDAARELLEVKRN